MQHGRKTLGGVLLAALSAAAFGIMPVFAKIAYQAGASAYTLLLFRFGGAAAVLFALMLAKKLPLPDRKDIPACLLLGGAGYVGQSLCYFTAINYASSGTVSLLFYTYPALVMMGAALVFREKVTVQKLLALALALFGAFLVIGGGFQARPKGIVLALATSLIYTVYILVSSRVVKPGMQIQSSAFIMLGAALVLGVINLFTGFAPPVQPSGWLAAGAIALFCTALAVWAFFTGVELTGPSTTSLVSTLEPVVTVLASACILAEPVTPAMLAGGALILVSLVVTVAPERKK